MAAPITKTIPRSDKFTLNDLHFWVWAYDQFIGDIRDLLSRGNDLPEQATLEFLDRKLESEFEEDAEHQRHWWLYYDRAAEAMPLLESDGPEHTEHPIEGFAGYMDHDKIREYNEEEAYINLVGANVDRKLGELSAVKCTFYAEPIGRQFEGPVHALNKWAENIHDNLDMERDFHAFKFEMTAIGSGVIKMGHGINWNSSEFGLFKNFLQRRPFLTLEELQRFEDVFEYHQFEHIPSFKCVRYRGAQGMQANSLDHNIHKQFHHFEHISVADAKNRYPQFADQIRPGINEKCLELAPHLSLLRNGAEEMTTIIHHRIKFPAREKFMVPLQVPGGKIHHYMMEHPRYPVGHVTRIHNVGIVDMDLDLYNHGKVDYVQAVNYPSSKHGCGIGMVKFGRDPAIVHNKLHNGALSWFARSIKGGGFYVDGIVNDSDLEEASKGNRWIKVDFSKLKPHLKRKDVKLSDFVVDARPPAFPSAWSALMQMEEQAIDRGMRAGGAWRGERVGYSGVQQSIASQDAGMMHSTSRDILNYSKKEMSDRLFSNIVQFDGDRHIKFSRENSRGDREQFELNQPMLPIMQYDETGTYKMVPSFIKNHVGTMQFITKIEPESVVPDRPIERTQFFMQLLQFAFPYIQSQEGRIMLRGMQSEGMRIPSLNDSMDQIDALQQQQQQLRGQLEQIAKEYQEMLDSREWAKDKAEINQNLLRLMQKFVSDLSRANPDTVRLILSGQYPQLQNDFRNAISQLMQMQPTPGNVPSMPNMNTGTDPMAGRGQMPQGAEAGGPGQARQHEAPTLVPGGQR